MSGDDPSTPGQVAMAACLLEAAARKPGNVHRFADFDDATFLDFALSAGAIAGPMDRAPGRPVGETILEAVAATRALVGTNTNLGMVLLLAPLAAVPTGEDLREGVATILDRTTVEDADLAYRAIRLASPGGLGAAPEGQDVAGAPTVTLREAMRLAADRDLVARQYATGYADVFDRFVPDLAEGLARPGRSAEVAIVGATLRSLADRPDTLIARKLGTGVAREASARAAAVVRSGWPDAPGSAGALADLDAWLRGDGHARNPGATADLVAAGLFVAIREGIMARPVATRWDGGPFRAGHPPDRARPSPGGAFAVPGSRFHKVRVSTDDLVFASGHFITYDGGKCEPLHGHNYRMAVEVEDELNGDHYVYDFVALHATARALAAGLDHKMILPGRSELIRVAEDGPNWDVRYADRRWSFPRDECVVLPLANTTAELLADYFAGRLLLDFEAKRLPRPRILRVEVEESFGQSAQMEWRRES